MINSDCSKRTLYDIACRQRYLFFENKQYINLSSNDYLGLSSVELQQEFMSQCDLKSHFLLSNPSSRLLCGNSLAYGQLEDSLSGLFEKESALVLSSGFMVNQALLSAVCGKRDLVIADKLVHASIIDGMRLASCDCLRYRHNDMAHLRSILESKRDNYQRVVVVTESVFSMDGDIAPILQLVELKKEFDLMLYVDEAHAFGLFGDKGCGVCEELGVLDQIDIIVVTLGKAIASQGGVVVSSSLVRDELINKMRSLIFSTAIPDISLMWSRFIIERLPLMNDKRRHLKEISNKLRDGLDVNISSSHIVPYIIGGNEKTIAFQKELANNGYWVAAIRHPTVAKGSERVRISLSAYITESDIDRFVSVVDVLRGRF